MSNHAKLTDNVGRKSNIFQIRIDSVDDESTAPITEANSREDLIDSAARESEIAAIEQTAFQFPSGWLLKYLTISIKLFVFLCFQSTGFLSVPTLRNSQHSSLSTSRRQVVSSPAKSERMIRSNQIKLRPRRLSQDSGIVAGRLVGYAVSISYTKPPLS